MSATPLFAFEDVRVAGDDGWALDEIGGALPPAGITVVVGPSGSGKSTMLRLCNRLEVPSAGRVLFRGDDVAGLDPLQLRRRVGLVFPQPVLLGGTVADELRQAAPAATEQELRDALTGVELPPAFLVRQSDSLSSGEAQRVCFARTLLTGPEVLLADEPTASVDVGLRAGLERLVRRLADAGTAVVWVTHDLDQARRLADHLVVMAAGRIEAAGAPGTAAVDAALARFQESAGDAG